MSTTEKLLETALRLSEALTEEYRSKLEKSKAPIAMRLPCERCGTLHIDVGHFATHPHHTHTCQHCGLNWRPAKEHTVGVQWVPGFKNEEPPVTVEDVALFQKNWATGGPITRLGEQRNDGPRSEGLGSQANEEPRPIVSGSTWQYRDGWQGVVTKIWPAALGQKKELISCGPPGGMVYEWPKDAFLRAFTWVRDP